MTETMLHLDEVGRLADEEIRALHEGEELDEGGRLDWIATAQIKELLRRDDGPYMAGWLEELARLDRDSLAYLAASALHSVRTAHGLAALLDEWTGHEVDDEGRRLARESLGV